MPYDLFGEIPVTEDECRAWVEAVAPRWLYPERSYRAYVRNYDVPGKIRAAKLRGEFWHIIDQPAHAWHARLALDCVI